MNRSMNRKSWGAGGTAVRLALATIVFWGLLALRPTWGQQGGTPGGDATAGTDAATDGSLAQVAASRAGRQGAIPTVDVVEIMTKGGVLMWPILGCSIITLVFVFERLISLRRGRVIPDPFVKRLLHQLREGQLDRDEALLLCEQNGSPVAQVFAGALQKWGRPTVEVEQALIDAGERAANGLRRYLRVFNGVSTVSPLLGLLGTVFGMIKAFNTVASSQALGRPELLANGIAEALLTTAFGLTVAIPALICYWIFVSRVDQLIIALDARGQELAGLISADAGAEPPHARAARARKREATASKQSSPTVQ